MALLDPEAATSAWLSRISPADRALAGALTDLGHLSWLGGGLIAILVCWLILKSGLIARLRDAIEREGPRPWLASAACGGAFVALLLALQAPWPLFIAWRLDRLQGHPFNLLANVHVLAGHVLLGVAMATVFLALIYAVIRRAPRTWWAWVGGVAAALAFAAVLAPFALASGPAALPPAPTGPVRDGLVRLIGESGLAAKQVYLSSNPEFDADVTGLPGQPRVVISRGMADGDPAVARAYIGHLLGHYAHGDQLGFAAVLAGLAFAGAFAAGLLYRPLARLLGMEFGVADPAGLPIMAAILLAWIIVATPLFNAFDRAVNVRADQYSLDHAREPDGLAAMVLRQHGADRADPSPLEEAVFYDHPSVRSRVLHAMQWKAAHAG